MSRFKAKQVLVALFIMLIVFLSLQYRATNWQVKQFSAIDEPQPGQSVLIVAPHCDDETLGTGALISRLVNRDVHLQIVVMTNGDGFPRAAKNNFLPKKSTKDDFIDLGQRRQKETEQALSLLGLNPEDIVFLGYPDTGLYRLWTPQYWESSFTSPYTGSDFSPYLNAFTAQASYRGASVVKDLTQIISELNPDFVFYPHPNDSHADHWATFCFIKYVLTDLDTKAQEYLYLVHRGTWPLIFPLYGRTYLTPPRKLTERGAEWSVLELSPAEFDLKKQALKAYVTQMRVMEYKLLSFCRRNELFATYPDSTILKATEPDPRFTDYLLVLNPEGDLPLHKVQISADLVALSGCITIDDELQLSLRARGKINKIMGYTYDMFFFMAGDEQSRLVVTWQQGKLVATIYKDGQALVLPDIAATVDEKTLTIFVPSTYWVGADRVFLGCVSSQGNARIDNLAWRTYRLPLTQKLP